MEKLRGCEGLSQRRGTAVSKYTTCDAIGLWQTCAYPLTTACVHTCVCVVFTTCGVIPRSRRKVDPAVIPPMGIAGEDR
jgi:hypothetical protein